MDSKTSMYMNGEDNLIDFLISGFPFDIRNKLLNEFQTRKNEAEYLISKYSTYKGLRRYKTTVELLLALSIFHKRVISNLDAAVKFYGTVTTRSQADTISIGAYKLNFEEKNHILAVVMAYHKLLEKFSVPDSCMNYMETKEFLRNLNALKTSFTYADNQRKRKQDGDKS